MSISLNSSATTAVLRRLQANPAAKLLLVNTVSLVVPRILIDYQRNRYAGQETARYELASILNNYILPGTIGMGTAAVLGSAGNPFKVNATGWVGNDYVHALSAIYRESLKSGDVAATRKAFIQNTLAQLQGTDSFQRIGETPSVQTLKPAQLDDFANRLDVLMRQPKPDTKGLNELAGEIAKELGTFDQIRLRPFQAKGTAEALAVHPEKLVSNLHYLAGEFQKGQLPGTTQTAKQIGTNIEQIAQKLTRTNVAKTAVGLGVAAGLGFATQFINRAITRARTGKTGFVGYTNFADDLPARGQPIGLLSMPPAPNAMLGNPVGLNPGHPASAFNPAMLSPLLAKPWPSQQASPLGAQNATIPQTHFAGGLVSSQFLPTVAQLKYVIYPAGIVGKLLASREWDEFRETTVKAGFAYFNFLMIPTLVENLMAYAFRNKNAFSQSAGAVGATNNAWSKLKDGFQAINQSKLRSYQDIEIYGNRAGEALKSLSDQALRQELQAILGSKAEGVMKQLATDTAPQGEVIAKAVMQQLSKIKNISTVAGLVYSCLTLGIGLNVLNAKMTNRRQAEREAAEQATTPTASPIGLPSTGHGMNPMLVSGAETPFRQGMPAMSLVREPKLFQSLKANAFVGA
jgi:hypothetical protein